MFCSNCGKELPGDSAFCSKCGMNLKPRPVPSSPPASVAWIIALVIIFFAAVLCIAGFIFVNRLSEDQPIDVLPNTAAAAADAVGSADTSASIDNVADKAILGLWSTEGPSGELVDPVTGYASGSIYNGEWYLFRSDGTYRYVIISSGIVIDGGVVCEGKYIINNGEIKLSDIKESWYPNPAATGQKDAYKNKKIVDIIIKYQCGDDNNTLIINDSDYFTRVEE